MPTIDNAYPNGFNYPEPSFPQALPAPEVDPDDPDLELMLVEYNPAWVEVLMAACDQMLLYASWAGDHDEKILAVNRASVLKWMLQNPVYVPERDLPTPYWDSETDVDDDAPIDEQEWYGQTSNPDAPAGEVTFVQNAVIWLLTGFVAIVAAPTLPAGVAAAIAFRTLAVRFTLAFNRGDIREQFRVIIDAEDYGSADTDGLSTGDIIEMKVDGLSDAEFHDILIVRTTP
jgi:hypothetical protein